MGSAAQNLLILPLNVAVLMPAELDGHSSIVWQELEYYLRAHGKQLKTVSFEVARRFWLSSIEQVRAGEKGAKAGYDEAARVLVERLAKHAEFDTVIAPSLYLRKANVFEKTATWDGVERTVQVEAKSPVAREIAADTPLEGLAPAASLHVVVLDARGNKIQETQGGLELLVGVRVRPSSDAVGGDPSFEFAMRPDLLENRQDIREGIAIALSPFLPRLPTEAR